MILTFKKKKKTGNENNNNNKRHSIAQKKVKWKSIMTVIRRCMKAIIFFGGAHFSNAVAIKKKHDTNNNVCHLDAKFFLSIPKKRASAHSTVMKIFYWKY